jgi:hypothetical protein
MYASSTYELRQNKNTPVRSFYTNSSVKSREDVAWYMYMVKSQGDFAGYKVKSLETVAKVLEYIVRPERIAVVILDLKNYRFI